MERSSDDDEVESEVLGAVFPVLLRKTTLMARSQGRCWQSNLCLTITIIVSYNYLIAVKRLVLEMRLRVEVIVMVHVI